MSTQNILRVLALRHRLRQRDRWTRRQLKEHQGRALRLLREHAPALETLRRRYAAGEISHEEYDRMLEAIERRSSRDDRH